MRKSILLGLLAGLVAVLASGAGVFAVLRADLSKPGPVECGPYECIPGVKLEQLMTALRAKGHTCKVEGYWNCEFEGGKARFAAGGETQAGLVHSATATVTSMTDHFELTATGKAYLMWFASLPFADNPAALAEVEAWVTKQIKEKKTIKANIGGYGYSVEVGQGVGNFVRVMVRAVAWYDLKS